MAVGAICFASPVLVLGLLHSAAVQGVDHCYLFNETCPDVCCGLHWNATCCFRSNSTDWWTTDYTPVATLDMRLLIGVIVGSTLGALLGLIIIIIFCGLVCKVSCCRNHAPGHVITTSTGQGIPIVSPKEGYVFPGSIRPAASGQDRRATETQGDNMLMSKSAV